MGESSNAVVKQIADGEASQILHLVETTVGEFVIGKTRTMCTTASPKSHNSPDSGRPSRQLAKACQKPW